MKTAFKNSLNKIKDRVKQIFNSHLTPEQIAFNALVGILVGLLIPMGFQTIAVIALCSLFKLNFLIVVTTTLITNPFTFVLIYFSAFKIGELLNNSGISWDTIHAVLNNPEFETVLSLSLESLKVIYTGLFIESVLLAPVVYVIVQRFSQKYLNNKRNHSTELAGK